jgi:hypothetical protein
VQQAQKPQGERAKSTADSEREAKFAESKRICELMYPRALAAVQETMGADLKFVPRLIVIDGFKSSQLEHVGGMQLASVVIITLNDLESCPMPSYYLLAHKMTHEITHTWLKYNNPDLPQEVTEGICEVSAAISTKRMFNGGARVTINEAIVDTIAFAKVTGGLPAEILLTVLPPEARDSRELTRNLASYIVSSYAIADEMAKWRDSKPERKNASPSEFMKHLLSNWATIGELPKLSSRNSTEWMSANIPAMNRRMLRLLASAAKNVRSPISSTMPGYTTMLLRGAMNAGPDAVSEQNWQTQFREAEEKKELASREKILAKIRRAIDRTTLLRGFLPAWMGIVTVDAVKQLIKHHESLTVDLINVAPAIVPIALGVYAFKKFGMYKRQLKEIAHAQEEILSIVRGTANNGPNPPPSSTI